ncbi:MAG: hypothetical protein AB7Q29_08385 [Vicinamibacterales bacterium]
MLPLVARLVVCALALTHGAVWLESRDASAGHPPAHRVAQAICAPTTIGVAALRAKELRSTAFSATDRSQRVVPCLVSAPGAQPLDPALPSGEDPGAMPLGSRPPPPPAA